MFLFEWQNKTCLQFFFWLMFACWGGGSNGSIPSWVKCFVVHGEWQIIFIFLVKVWNTDGLSTKKYVIVHKIKSIHIEMHECTCNIETQHFICFYVYQILLTARFKLLFCSWKESNSLFFNINFEDFFSLFFFIN